MERERPTTRDTVPARDPDAPSGTIVEKVLTEIGSDLQSLMDRKNTTASEQGVPMVEATPDGATVAIRTDTVDRRRVDGGSESVTQAVDHLTVPIVEERLTVQTEVVPLGEVEVRVGVDQEQHRSEHVVHWDDVEVVRKPKGDRLDKAPQPYRDGDWYVVPIVQEELVVTKVFRLVEEVRIRTRPVAETVVVNETLRRTRVDIVEPDQQVDAPARRGDDARPGRAGR